MNGVLKLVQLDHIKSNRSYLIRLIIFKNGRCNKAKNECRFSHPKICHKFNQFGPKNGINKGCDDSCEFYHPNACRNSVKDRTCSYEMCRFYHLKGTKLISRQVQTKQNTQKPKLFKKQENYKPKFSKISNESKAKNIGYLY